MTTRPRRGRPRAVDLDAAAQAALDLGLETVTLRDVAEHIGVSVPGLYHHVANREELLSLATDRAVAAFSVPDPEPDEVWDGWLERLAWRFKAALARYPGMAEHVASYPRVPPAVVEHEERIVAILAERLGLPERFAIRLVEGVMTFVVMHVARAQAYARADLVVGQAFAADRRRLAADPRHPHAARVFSEIGLGTDDAQFDFTLTLLLRGARATPGPATPPGQP